MPRKPRVKIVGVSQHAIHWCNNRQVIFAGDTKAYDFFYLNDLLKRLKPCRTQAKGKKNGPASQMVKRR
jgi:hypothetical protein